MSHALHYRPLEAGRVTGLMRLWPLARQEMTALFRTKWGVALLFICLFPSLGRLVMLLIVFGVVNVGPPGLRDRLSQNLPPELDHLKVALATVVVVDGEPVADHHLVELSKDSVTTVERNVGG